MNKWLLVFGFTTVNALTGCAGMNPNPGERTADLYMFSNEAKDCERSLQIVIPNARSGYPWAELRLGYAYMTGCGVKKDKRKAAEWFKNVVSKTADGGWASGRVIGVIGRSGYFNQNSDALIAQHYLSTIYLESESTPENLIEAYLYAKNVADSSDGKSIYFCCSWAGGLFLSPKTINDNLSKIEASLTEEQKKYAREKLSTWKP